MTSEGEFVMGWSDWEKQTNKQTHQGNRELSQFFHEGGGGNNRRKIRRQTNQ